MQINKVWLKCQHLWQLFVERTHTRLRDTYYVDSLVKSYTMMYVNNEKNWIFMRVAYFKANLIIWLRWGVVWNLNEKETRRNVCNSQYKICSYVSDIDYHLERNIKNLKPILSHFLCSILRPLRTPLLLYREMDSFPLNSLSLNS